MNQPQTSRFFLKEITQEDIDHIFKGLSNPEVTQFYAVHFPTLEATQEQMDWYEDLKKNNTGLWWGIWSKEKEVFVGAGGFNGLEKENRKAEIGLWLLPEYWGRGILGEIMPCLFREGFENLNLNRIEGFVDADNVKCRRALEKINFSYEGTMRQVEFKDGQFLDVAIYSILKEEFSPKPVF
ncbi:GNAT family N-acetyltransferase [Salinimicrobium sp. CAU 1759]